MKKTNTKLQLKSNTVRMLQTADLEPVNGGRRATLGCTAAATGCSCPTWNCNAGNLDDGH